MKESSLKMKKNERWHIAVDLNHDAETEEVLMSFIQNGRELKKVIGPHSSEYALLTNEIIKIIRELNSKAVTN